MNAPATITRPPALPWNLTPYGPGEFDKMHGPGSMLVSSSNLAALFGLIPQRLGKLAYALHLNGERPLPDIGEEPLIRVGHALEPLVAALLAEETGGKLVEFDAYARHDWLPMFATPDRGLWIDGELYMVEIKVVTPKVYWEKWREGPPINNQLQHQGQYACTGAKRGIIAVFNLGWCQLEHFETRPHPGTIEKIEFGVDHFMDRLKRGELPDPDDNEIDAEAWRFLKWQSDPEKMIWFDTDEAERRAGQFIQAKADYSAAEKTIDAHKRWFQKRMGEAEEGLTNGGVQIKWKTNKSKSKGQDRPNRVFGMKEPKEEDDG